MGGPGSGRWYRWDGTKTTVEESLTLGIADFRGRLSPFGFGTFTWTWAGGRQASVGYSVTWNADTPTVTLHYRLKDEIDVRIPVRLQVTYPALGGQRWWFTCPLIVGGVACNRRVAKLYLPPSARYFGCRRCHDLAYRSSQEAHEAERMAMLLGFGPEIGRLLDSRRGGKRVR